MSRKIEITGKPQANLEVIGRAQPRIEPEVFAKALGAESCTEQVADSLDLISLAELGTQLLHRLHSSGGRPALADATEMRKVPLSVADVVEELIEAKLRPIREELSRLKKELASGRKA